MVDYRLAEYGSLQSSTLLFYYVISHATLTFLHISTTRDYIGCTDCNSVNLIDLCNLLEYAFFA